MQRDGAAFEAPQLVRMGSALAGDCPDAVGSWVEGGVGLGAGINEAESGDAGARAVLVSGDGELALVGDGHLDNRRQMATELGLSRDDTLGLSTPALILCAFEQWGEGCLERLVGEFTFALWNRGTRTLLVGCSAPLARPLYYHASGRLFAFASLARGLFALPHVRRQIDEERVAGFLTRVDTGQSRSFFEDVQRLLPGQLLTLGAKGLKVAKWWRPDLSDRLALDGDDEYLEAFQDLFGRVIDDHLSGSSGPTGIMLSGGLDSGAIAAVAAPALDLEGRRLVAYTEVPRHGFSGRLPQGRYADETPFVEELARMYPAIDMELVRGCRRGLLDDTDRLFAAAEVPFKNAANRGWMETIYERARSRGLRMLLTGDQGNLTVSWDGSGLLSELLRQGRFAAVISEARRIATEAHARSAGRVVLAQAVAPLLPAPLRIGVARLRAAHRAGDGNPYETVSLIAPAFAAELGLTERAALRGARQLAGIEGDHRALRLGVLVRTGSVAAALHAGYRATFGIDTRSPLADRRLVEFCLQLPEVQYARAGQDRLLIRRALAGRLPAQTLHARDRGLQAADWFEQMSEERPELLAAVARFEADGLTARVLDLPRLRRLLEQWPDRSPTDHGDVALYRGAIGAAMITGAFLLWAQNGET